MADRTGLPEDPVERGRSGGHGEQASREEGAVAAGFAVPLVGLGQQGTGARRLTPPLTAGSPGRWIAAVGIGAAAVQVIGLSRWVVLVPWISDPGVVERLHFWLGSVAGETVGYALTAVFTVLVAHFVVRGGWLTLLGHVSAS